MNKYIILACMFLSVSGSYASSSIGGIDPSDMDQQYAWSEGVGWINLEVSSLVGGSNEVIVSEVGVSGYAWLQSSGWMNFSPNYSGVTNTCDGRLSGYAWGEGLGWIDFSGVRIDEDGYFRGIATNNATGDIIFDCRDSGDGCDDVDFSVRTQWRPSCEVEIVSSGLGGGSPSFEGSIIQAPGPESPEEDIDMTKIDEEEDVDGSGDLEDEEDDIDLLSASCHEPYLYTSGYRVCSRGGSIDSFFGFAQNIACEGFIVAQESPEKYNFEQPIQRKEMAGIAYKMLRVEPISKSQYQHNFLDIGLPGQAPWIQPVVETDLYYKIISPNQKYFRPDDMITRAEAFAMAMAAVCLYPTGPSENDWQKNIYEVAQQEGITMRSWENFGPTDPLLRQEAFVLASRAADWADRSGGCVRVSPQCQLYQK